MKRQSFWVLLLALLSFSGIHKFYVSVTNVNYAVKEDALQITSRIFTDDLDFVMEERYGFKAQLGTSNENPRADAYLEKYVRSKFTIRINGRESPYHFIGKKVDNDVVICYLEIPKVNYSQIKSIAIQNEILMDVFDDQQNVVHLKMGVDKKSFMFVRGNSTGMLNL